MKNASPAEKAILDGAKLKAFPIASSKDMPPPAL